MRIGSSTNWLEIERTGPQLACRFTAASEGAGLKFEAIHDRVFIDISEHTIEEIDGFIALKVHQLELRLSDGGWLRIKRHIKGFIIVRYRVSCLNGRTAFEGEIIMVSGAADGFYRDLKALLCIR
jgi:hypothetical protein